MKNLKIVKMMPVVLLAGLLGIIFSCNNVASPEEVLEKNVKLPSSTPSVQLISKAGQKSYWKHAGQNLRSSTASDENKNRIVYPFDSITIHKVTRYTAKPFDVGPFEGINELFVTEFSVDWGNHILLTIKHDKGEYSCLDNGNIFTPYRDIGFSSHIQITESAIFKDLTYPIHGYHVRSTENEGAFFGYKVALSIAYHPYEPGIWFPLKDKNEVTANDIYLVKELAE